ncbi:hypothetical protein BJY04DRAFT_51561 [Aspergillus karnatakaensis]|uniref:uncharacterized protein n=1 Tax=Aspergillus karnatakaensis TaxID=1810916 RepID=UPI003CCD9E47
METKRDKIEISRLRKMTQTQTPRRVVVDEGRFCQIITQATNDLNSRLDQPHADLKQAFLYQSQADLDAQGQAQSLLRNLRFHHWMKGYHPDLLLVDANIRSAGLENLSAISAFCATLIANLVKIRPGEVVIHFFCGLHSGRNDPWHGPGGHVRSLIMQLFVQLLTTDLLHDRRYLLALEEHDLVALCDDLHSLLSQFTANTTVYCIIDTVSSFDGRIMFADLAIVMECLREIVNDTSLSPVVKVLITNPGHSTARTTELPFLQDDPSRLVVLSPRDSLSDRISDEVVEGYILGPTREADLNGL